MVLRLLFLDDDDIQNDIMQEYTALCDVPSESTYFTDGYKAIQYLKKASDEELPHVLFIDVFMPLMDGWEILEQLEPIMEKKQWSPSIYILTSSVSNKDREMARTQQYMKAFLNKPMNLKRMKPILKDEYTAILSVSR